jgi:hypothetical protein
MEQMQMPYIPMARPGSAREVAYAVLFFASDECRYATGDELIIDGGGTHLGTLYPGTNEIDNADFNIGDGGMTVAVD